jgi:hypothetical protein
MSKAKSQKRGGERKEKKKEVKRKKKDLFSFEMIEG